MTPIGLLHQAADYDLKLGFEPPDVLVAEPADRVPADFVPALKAHKPELLALLKLPFVMVFSETLGETIFFCADDDTRAALVERRELELSDRLGFGILTALVGSRLC